MGSQLIRKSFCDKATFQWRSGEGVQSVIREGNGLGKPRKDQQASERKNGGQYCWRCGQGRTWQNV